jgi:hypothetical protein
MKVIFVLVAALCAASLFAQSTTFAVQGGAVLSDLVLKTPAPLETSSANKRIRPDIGAHFNFVVTQPIGDDLAIGVEPGLTLKRTRDDFGDVVAMYFAQLPIMLSARVIDRLAAEAGPDLSYLLKVGDGRLVGGVDPTDFYNRFQINMTAGLQYRITRVIAVGGRAAYSLNALLDVEFTDDNGQTVGKSKLLQWYGQLFLRYEL